MRNEKKERKKQQLASSGFLRTDRNEIKNYALEIMTFMYIFTLFICIMNPFINITQNITNQEHELFAFLVLFFLAFQQRSKETQ